MPRDHWVPQFLLGKFTPSGKKDDTFWKYDTKTRTFSESCPYDVCYEDGLYELDEQSIQRALESGKVLGPRGLEEGLSREVENQAAIAIHRIDRDGQPANQSDLDWLVSFLAMQVIRTPYYMGRFVHELGANVRYNDILALALGDQPRIFQGLRERAWTLHMALPGEGYFVTTDNPVQLMTESGENLDIVPGSFQSKDSVVTLPLSKTLLLAGRNEGARDMTYEVDRPGIAWMNSITLRGLYLEAYAPQPELLVLSDGESSLVNEAHPRLPWVSEG